MRSVISVWTCTTTESCGVRNVRRGFPVHGAELKRLPNRRGCTTFDIVAGPLRYTTTVGYYSDGQIGEIFLDASKAGSDADSAARDSAITASIAMQFGADIETIRKALCRDALGRAVGPLGAALDMLAREER
jgi:hypothetical protein